MLRPTGRAVAHALGDGLAAVFGAVAAARHDKPLHPRGVVVPARLERAGLSEGFGVPWLDTPGVDECLVRFSRAMGLPAGWPDVLGLAVSFRDAQGRHDLLLASTGLAPGARHLLLPRTGSRAPSYGSLFPYVTPRGHVVLAARADQRERAAYALSVATPLGPWQPFGVLRLEEDPARSTDQLVDLDPVRHPLPGLALAPLLAALREPSYAAARRRRPENRSADAAEETARATAS